MATVTTRLLAASARQARRLEGHGSNCLSAAYFATSSSLFPRSSGNSAAGGAGPGSRSSSKSGGAGGEQDDATPQTQPFVQTRIRPGEWDPETRTNPLYRPQYRSRAKIWSGDDFHRQPTVGFTGQYESFADAAVTLSWLTQSDQKQIYRLYCDILQAASNEKRTSHEYIVRVIAQKFHLTPERVAAVIQLQHNEEQLIRKQQAGDENVQLYPEYADFMDNAIQQEINNAYKAFGLKKPDEFVEDPAFFGTGQERKTWQVVEDVFDVDQLLKDATVREEREARLIIDNYVYVEDVDEHTIEIPQSRDCRDLLKAAAAFQKQQQSQQPDTDKTTAPQKVDVDDAALNPLPAGGERRDRWKFVAQVVNTRKLRRQREKNKGLKKKPPLSYSNNSPENTLVEHAGTLRLGTLADVKQTAWKPPRHVCEHTYQGAKKGWLDRKFRGDTAAWGRAPPSPPPPPPVKTNAEVKAEASSSSGETTGENVAVPGENVNPIVNNDKTGKSDEKIQ